MANIKKRLNKILQLIIPLFSTLFIFSISAIIIAYGNGYKINFTTKKVIKTGTINIATKPNGADIYLDDQLVNKSNAILPDVTIGPHSIKIEKDKYYPYQRDFFIEHGYAYSINIPLIKQNDPKDFLSLANLQINIKKVLINKQNIYVLAAADQATEQSKYSPSLTTSKASSPVPTLKKNTDTCISFDLYKVEVKRRFFIETDYNLDKLLTLQLEKTREIKGIFETSNSIIVETNTLIEKPDKKKQSQETIPTYYLIKNTHLNGTLTLNDLEPDETINYYIKHQYKMKTYNQTPYIIFYNEDKIISYNPETKQKNIVYERLKKDTIFYWDLTPNYIFIAEQYQKDTQLVTSIKAKTYVGSIDSKFNMPLQQDLSTILKFKAIDTHDQTIFIITTQEATYLLGNLFDDSNKQITTENDHINDFEITHYPEESISRLEIFKGSITNFILNYPIDLIIFTDSNNKSLYVFKYNKEELDHSEKLGLTKIYESTNSINLIQNIRNPEFVLLQEQKEQDKSCLKIVSIHDHNIYDLACNDIIDVRTYLHGKIISYITETNDIFVIETE